MSLAGEDGEIEADLAQEPSPERATRKLLRHALTNGAPDNVTAVVIRITAGPPKSAPGQGAVKVLSGRETFFGEEPAPTTPLDSPPPFRKGYESRSTM